MAIMLAIIMAIMMAIIIYHLGLIKRPICFCSWLSGSSERLGPPELAFQPERAGSKGSPVGSPQA